MGNPVTDDVLIPMREVVRITGISRSEVWRRVKNQTMPQPTRDLGPHCTRWSASEVREWVRARLAARPKAEGEGAAATGASA